MNESSTQDAPTEDPGGTPALTAVPAEAPLVEPVAPEAAPIAPGVERLARPLGTARAIPDAMLGHRPSPVFLAVIATLSFVADISTKLWAEKRLAEYPGYITVVEDHLLFVLAKNKGGAWGLLQGESESVRRPFFLLVSVAAIAFIVTLYRRLQPRQYALKWGLPLVLGGALGNVFDRIRYGHVIDFIDYRADAIRAMNELILKYVPRHVVTDHWPTFNVADIAICVGVALMAIDMVTSRRGKRPVHVGPDVPIEPTISVTGEPPAGTGEPPLGAGEPPLGAGESVLVGGEPTFGAREPASAEPGPVDEHAPPPSRS